MYLSDQTLWISDTIIHLCWSVLLSFSNRNEVHSHRMIRTSFELRKIHMVFPLTWEKYLFSFSSRATVLQNLSCIMGSHVQISTQFSGQYSLPAAQKESFVTGAWLSSFIVPKKSNTTACAQTSLLNMIKYYGPSKNSN